ncbi:MAG TPA: Asp23/Gls24 family envelope stress response protein [Clostridiaceae bacterium]|nr:Asp23/Gls24 family envelope stress response protein [Clostridiaceae bacterium]
MTDIVKNEIHEDKIIIADEVLSTIAGVSATSVKGVTSLSGGLVDGIAGILGRKNLGKGVKVESNDKEVIIEIALIVEYGCKIHVVAREVQNVVRSTIEDMTGMRVAEVDVNVVGISMDKDSKKLEASNTENE